MPLRSTLSVFFTQIHTSEHSGMKSRLLVMNGQRIVQTEKAGEWANAKVEKAGAVKPGIYNLYLATPADPAKTHDGVVIHADQEKVFQQVGKSFVQHERAAFDKIPEIGVSASITYAGGKAVVAASSAKLSRGISR